jgi:hypothetical protein
VTVGNLSDWVTAEDLIDLFVEHVGTNVVKCVDLPGSGDVEQGSWVNFGRAWVTLVAPNAVPDAISALDRKAFQGLVIEVERPQPRAQSSLQCA